MARARAAGVRGVLVPAVEEKGWGRLRALSGEFGWRFALGTHPCALSRSRSIPRDLSGASAIGECGLDGRVPVAMDEQVRVLEGHLALARESGLPVVLHGYRAHGALVATLKRWSPVRGVLHSYSGGAELVPIYVGLGLHLSFGGALTWPGARKPLEALMRVPRARLLAETDAPDQRPSPHSGRSEPSMLPLVVAAMERLRGEALAQQLVENAAALGW
ncbi:deoxyribonuclease [Deltaproteobacteria bacterium]|nr:deoxyribonuclease [Deltaproteobacteria bacterium]